MDLSGILALHPELASLAQSGLLPESHLRPEQEWGCWTRLFWPQDR